MPRIPYLTDDEAGPAELLDPIRHRRGGALIELDRILLHSPPVAEGWNQYFERLRGRLALAPLHRELAMCAVAVLNGADYEWHHHAPIYRDAGASEPQVTALERLASAPEAVLQDPAWDDTQRALLRVVWQSTRQVRVDHEAFAAARAALGSDRLMLELLAVTAAYNMVSRILVAFEVQPSG